MRRPNDNKNNIFAWLQGDLRAHNSITREERLLLGSLTATSIYEKRVSIMSKCSHSNPRAIAQTKSPSRDLCGALKRELGCSTRACVAVKVFR